MMVGDSSTATLLGLFGQDFFLCQNKEHEVHDPFPVLKQQVDRTESRDI